MLGHQLSCLLFCLSLQPGMVQEPQVGSPPVVKEVAAGDNFHRVVIETAVKQVKAGTMKRRELLKLRVAMLSPAFREAAEDLAVTQMAASGSDAIPLTPDGAIDRASIDWDAIIAFIEKLIPLIMRLMEIFGGTATIDLHLDSLGAPMFAVVSVGDHCFTFMA